MRAHDNLAHGTVSIGRGELHNASRNRSRTAFERNPKADRAHFPDAIDPRVTVLRLRQGGRDVGAITWFPARHVADERQQADLRRQQGPTPATCGNKDDPGMVASFPQTNAGDMTPNLNLIKMHPSGPTDDHTRNCEIIGRRQYDAGRGAFSRATPMSRGGVDAVIRYVDMSRSSQQGFTPDGRPASTTPAMMGAAAAATSTEDNTRSQLSFLQEGLKNPLVRRFGAKSEPSIAPWIRDMQSPKLVLFPLGLLPPSPWVPHVVPLQIMRIGQLVLVAVPAESTIVAGLRLRAVVADALRVSVDVLVQGYSNAYTQYVTTPEEYDAQQYEGGETMYGRYTLPAYLQEFHELGSAMRSGRDLGRGPAPLDKSGFQPDLLPPVPIGRPVAGRRFGQVLTAPKAAYRPGQTATARLWAYPASDLHTGGTYLDVQKADGDSWTTIADDWSTTLRWSRPQAVPTRRWSPSTGRSRRVPRAAPDPLPRRLARRVGKADRVHWYYRHVHRSLRRTILRRTMRWIRAGYRLALFRRVRSRRCPWTNDSTGCSSHRVRRCPAACRPWCCEPPPDHRARWCPSPISRSRG